MENKIKKILETVNIENELSVSQYLSIVLATKGYYNDNVSKNNLQDYMKIKTEGNIDNELFSGYMRPFISGVMVDVNGLLILTKIDGIYTSDLRTEVATKLEDIVNDDVNILWDTLENTFDNYITLHYQNDIDNITDNEIVIRLAKNEYILITKDIECPIMRIFKSTKNIIRNQMSAETLKDKLELKGLK